MNTWSQTGGCDQSASVLKKKQMASLLIHHLFILLPTYLFVYLFICQLYSITIPCWVLRHFERFTFQRLQVAEKYAYTVQLYILWCQFCVGLYYNTVRKKTRRYVKERVHFRIRESSGKSSNKRERESSGKSNKREKEGEVSGRWGYARLQSETEGCVWEILCFTVHSLFLSPLITFLALHGLSELRVPPIPQFYGLQAPDGKWTA